MYYFVQTNPNKKEKWQMLDVKQLAQQTVAFKTVLQVSNDPESFRGQGLDPDEKLRYIGPMYFDLDGTDIPAVLDSTRTLIDQLAAKGVKKEVMSIYLSGKKGVHITIPEQVFGVTTAIPYLPKIWEKFFKEFSGEHLDDNVYSMGKGRMWRTTGVKRPDNGKYKVQVSLSEIADMDAESYDRLTSEPRPDFAAPESIEPVTSLAAFVEAMKPIVRNEIRAKKKAADNISVEDLKLSAGVPGCIKTLITEGDCHNSNWNQAAMQLAGYIAGRYTRDDETEFTEELVEPFIENVESSGRPTAGERLRALNDLLGRAFAGSVKFSAGGVISTIGKPCGNCVICSREKVLTQTDEGEYYCEETKIKFTPYRLLMVGENSSRTIANFGIEQEDLFMEIDIFNQMRANTGYYRIQTGHGPSFKIEIPESVFADRRNIAGCLNGTGGSFTGNESDLQALGIALSRRRSGLTQMIRSPQSGIIFHEHEGELYPQLVTAEESYAKGNLPSKFVYTGQKHLAADFRRVPDFVSQEEVDTLTTTLRSLFNMNERHLMVTSIGWVMATHLKTHLAYYDKQFPMLNFCGTSHTGKSSTAFLLLALNGFGYQKAPFWNAEVDTPFPLEEMVSSTTTTIRLIEEANEVNARRNWSKLIGLLKASWDAGGIMKGGLQGRTVTTKVMPNPAPLLYLSEQSFPIQSIRTRSLECHFSTSTLENPELKVLHQSVVKNSKSLEMMAKVLATTALNTSLATVEQWKQEAYARLPSAYVGRTEIAYGTVFVGLRFLRYVMETFNAEFAAEIEQYEVEYLTHLEGGSEALVKGKKHSALDDILLAFDTMAAERDNQQHGLEVGIHYWAVGEILYLDIRATFPRFRRYSRGIGSEVSVSTAAQVTSLIRGESYFKGITAHPHKPQVEILMLDLDALRKKGTSLVNFEIGEAKA